MLWKRCDLEHCVRNLYGQRRYRKQFYNHGFLRDACNVTVEPTSTHPLYEHGLRYTQLYSSYKNIFDARKQWPFDVPYLEYLSLNSATCTSFQTASGNTRINAQEIRENYKKTKKRGYHSIRKILDGSQPNREEHRASYAFWAEKIMPRVNQLAANLPTQPKTFEEMDYAWKIPVKGWAGFLHANMNKMAVLFEVASAKASQKLALKNALLAFAAVKLLRLTPSASDIRRDSALSKDQHLVPGPNGTRDVVRYGLGMLEGMNTTGYGWIMTGRINWSNFDFSSQYAGMMLFRTDQLTNQHKRMYATLTEIESDIMHIGQCGDWLLEYKDKPSYAGVRRVLYDYMAHLVLRSFRQHVLREILTRAKRPKHEIQEILLGDQYQLCYQDICKVLMTEDIPVLDLQSSNVKWNSLTSWFDVYFGNIKSPLVNPLLKRTHWHGAPFRLAYLQAVKCIEAQESSADQVEKFITNNLKPYLFKFNRFFPNIDGSGNLMPRAKPLNEHKWRTIQEFRRSYDKREEQCRYREWTCGTPRAYCKGRPTRVPDYLSWSIQQWELHLKTIR